MSAERLHVVLLTDEQLGAAYTATRLLLSNRNFFAPLITDAHATDLRQACLAFSEHYVKIHGTDLPPLEDA